MKQRPDPSVRPSDADLAAVFMERLVNAAGATPQPSRFGASAYVGSARVASAVLRDTERFHKHYDAVERLGLSRFNTEGDSWSFRRSVTQQRLAAAGRRSNATFVRELIEAEIATCEPTTNSVVEAFVRVGSRAFFAALGATAGPPAPGLILQRVRSVAGTLQIMALFGASGAEPRRIEAEATALREGAREFCEADRGLAAFCAEMNSRSERPDDFEASTEILFTFFAGVETTVSTFTFALEMLGQSLEAQERIADEIAEHGAEGPLLDAFLNETMRFFPPIPFLMRRAVVDVELPDVTVRSGESVFVSLFAVHRDPTVWSRPLVFDPFRREFRMGDYDKRGFMPFSIGERICGGLTMARLELREGIAALLRRFRVERPPGPIGMELALTLRAAPSGRLTFLPRSGGRIVP